MEVVRVAVCDDDRISIERICEEVRIAFKEAKLEYQIYRFDSGQLFIEDLTCNEYDLILLDIMMPDVSGLSVAEEVYKISGGDNLVFVSNEEKMVYQVLGFRPCGFVRKSDLHEELKKTFRWWYAWFKQRRMISFTMGRDREEMHLKITDIVLIQANGHNVIIHTKKKQYDAKIGISELGFLLDLREFVRCNRSIICNLKYVLARRDNWLYLIGGEKISVGRKHSKEVWEKYNNYMKHESMGD